MEQFDHLEAAQEVAIALKAGGTDRAATFLRKLAKDFSGAAFAADLRKEKDFYAEALDLPVTDIEWMACTLEGNTQAMPIKATAITRCDECGSKDLSWFTSNVTYSGVQNGRLKTSEVTCLFVLGCNECSATLALVPADKIAELMNKQASA